MSDPRADDRSGETSGGREGWLERLIHRFSAWSRDSWREDLHEVLAEAESQDLTPAERALLRNVLGLNRVRVGDVMVPRADIAGVPIDTDLGELLAYFHEAGHSRLPTYGESLDEPLGMIHIRDFLDHIAARSMSGPPPEGGGKPAPDLARVDMGATLASANILRPVLFVPGSMPAIDLLIRMQASRTHMALVIDEYGGTDGLVSIEDLLETVVGEIEDEHDEVTDMIVREDGGGLLVDARAPIEEVSAALGMDLMVAAEDDDVDTLGGLIVTRAGRVPALGERFDGPAGLEFEVLDADMRRLKRVRIAPRRDPASDAAAEPQADRPGG